MNLTTEGACKDWFSKNAILGKTITGIRLDGNERWLDKSTFAIWYCNTQKEKLKKSVRRTEINDNDKRTCCVTVDGLIVLDFADGSNMALRFTEPTEVEAWVDYEVNNSESNIRIERIFGRLIGRTIVDIETVAKRENMEHWGMKLRLDNGEFLLWDYANVTYMIDENQPYMMTMKEYIEECLPNWEQYFEV